MEEFFKRQLGCLFLVASELKEVYNKIKHLSCFMIIVYKGGGNMLSPNEQKVLQMIQQNPYRSQQEIADLLEMNRSTVANVISSLMQKRELIGRAYVVNNKSCVYCIGGMNVDRKFQLLGNMQLKTSNPTKSTFSVGGVVRNVAENLGRLGVDVQLLSVAGMDQDFEWIKQQSQTYVNMQNVTQFADETTSTYSAVLDESGEMQLAMADMAICDRMDLAWIQTFSTSLKQARYIVMDLNVPLETCQYVISLAEQYQIPLAIIPVSAPKMSHLPKQLKGVEWLIVNEDESEAYFNQKIENEDDVIRVAEQWLETGVQQVVMTRGSRKSFYCSQSGEQQWLQPPHTDQVVDVTGAGDSFSAGLIYATLETVPAVTAIQYGMANAYHTIQVKETVRLDLTADLLKQNVQALFKERRN